MNKIVIWFIVGIVIGLVIGGAGGYFYANKSPRNFGNFNNFQINEQSKAEVISLFEGNSNNANLTSYCQQNRMNCDYYCRSINPNNEACKEIMNSSRMGGIPQKR